MCSPAVYTRSTESRSFLISTHSPAYAWVPAIRMVCTEPRSMAIDEMLAADTYMICAGRPFCATNVQSSASIVRRAAIPAAPLTASY